MDTRNKTGWLIYKHKINIQVLIESITSSKLYSVETSVQMADIYL